MKVLIITIFLAAVCITGDSASAQEKWDLNGQHLAGPVRSVRIELAEVNPVDSDVDKSKRRLHQEVRYDPQGNEIERTNFKRDGSAENRTVHIIDANGRIAGWEEYEPKPDGRGWRQISKSEWVYDGRGNRIEARVYRGEALTHLTTTTYDTAGHLIEEKTVTDGGAWQQTKKLSYDSGGHPTRTLIDTNGTTELIEQTYDNSGNLLSYKYLGNASQNNSEARYAYGPLGREIERDAEDSFSKFRMTTSYDVKGRVSERVTQFEYKQPNTSISHAPEPGTVALRYNDKDQLIEESLFSPEGALHRKTMSEYDSARRLRSQTYINGDLKLVARVTYEYDKRGNLIKRITEDLNPSRSAVINVEIRVVTYYDGQ